MRNLFKIRELRNILLFLLALNVVTIGISAFVKWDTYALSPDGKHIEQAYAVIVQGNMELECIAQLGWNKRCVIIRNALITNTINKVIFFMFSLHFFSLVTVKE